MANYPRPMKQREDLNLRLGIKSSLSKLRSLVASLYIIYKSNNKQSEILYSEEISNSNGLVSIKLEQTLSNKINTLYGHTDFSLLVENSPLFTSQLEALQVGLELFFHLCKIDFVHTSLSERTGSNRYQKKLTFATNMILVDLYLSSNSIEDVNKLLLAWLRDSSDASQLEDGLCLMLNTFTEETQFKIRDQESKEIIFNQEGVYSEIIASNEVSSADTKEPVGPLRVYKSYLSSGMHPFIVENKQTIKLREGLNITDLKCYLEMVDATLSMRPKSINIIQEEAIETSQQKIQLTSRNTASPSYIPFLTALRTKPFMLLAGISGTGKSRIAREIARACWNTNDPNYTAQVPENFCIIQVKPNWHDSTELLGYVSRVGETPHYVTGDFLPFIAKAWEHPNVPYILCLDEMNLAPVEQYLAEYLSVIESRRVQNNQSNHSGKNTITTDPLLKPVAEQWYYDLVQQITYDEDISSQFKKKGISIPQNLFVIGTVNMDETTFSFSRKVLDRAMTIEMNKVDLYGGLTETENNNLGYIGNDIIGDMAEGKDVYAGYQDICDEVLNYLKKVNEVLEGTPFKIAYRTRNEFLLYAVNRKFFATESKIWQALDEITSMKILSRIEGDDTKVSDDFLDRLSKTIEDELKTISGEKNTIVSISLAKLKEMKAKLASGYTSFWS